MRNTDKFEMIANTYETPERVQIATVSVDAIREYLIDAKGKDAIDFGCGTGLVGIELLNEFRTVMFLDTSQNMINQVKQKISRVELHNASTLCYDLETAALSDIHADYIFMAQVLLHIIDIESVLSRLYDVLNLGGHLIIVDFNKNDDIVSELVHNGFDQEELSDIMLKIGYKDVQIKTFYSGSKIFMGRDASLFVLDSQK